MVTNETLLHKNPVTGEPQAIGLGWLDDSMLVSGEKYNNTRSRRKRNWLLAAGVCCLLGHGHANDNITIACVISCGQVLQKRTRIT